MSHIPKLTTIGLYNYDEDLFGLLTLPAAYNKETFIKTFLMEYGERGVIYPSYEFLRFAIGTWGDTWRESLERIASALTTDYNPLHNYDRSETYTDTENIDGTYNTDTENKVSAYNSSAYQPDSKTEIDGTSGTDRTLQHVSTVKGNIGVTTSQQMLQAEVDLRTVENMYSIAAQMLATEICVQIF
ncbi:MAG: hypothetical protein VZR54_09440 [Ruminococcus sp.]|nr:hypothetical protein [Ruminococcus sp.]